MRGPLARPPGAALSAISSGCRCAGTGHVAAAAWVCRNRAPASCRGRGTCLQLCRLSTCCRLRPHGRTEKHSTVCPCSQRAPCISAMRLIVRCGACHGNYVVFVDGHSWNPRFIVVSMLVAPTSSGQMLMACECGVCVLDQTSAKRNYTMPEQ
jgi:hypothetical protein